jgi:(R)-2-hydroxyacyl-CoA dehydratese activating ATPase
MIVCGCDVGSTTGKAVVLIDDQVYCGSVIPANFRPEVTAARAIQEALSKAGLWSTDSLEYLVCTGYGRQRVALADENVSEISCHGKGAHWLCPSVRTVIDIGGQDVKVMKLNDKGRVLEFVMNDRCAAGTGRFFEGMARVLACGFEGISSLENVSETPAVITNQCSVFAESEVVTLINEGREFPDIITGINNAVAGRVHSLARKNGITEDLAMTGGCSKNEGLIKALERQIGIGMKRLPFDPQFVGALGAACFAREKLESRKIGSLAKATEEVLENEDERTANCT